MKLKYLLLLLILPALLSAQSKKVVNPLPNAAPKLPPNLFLRKLPNGLDVLVVEDNSVPLATVMMTFKCGAFTQTKATQGFYGLYQSMLNMGNKDDPSIEQVNFHAGRLGIQLRNSITADEYSTTYFTLPKANLPEGLKFLNSRIRYPRMALAEFEKEKGVELNLISQKESMPSYAFEDVMGRRLWGDLYFRKIAMGTSKTVESATLELMDTIKNKYFHPNNAMLIVGGDVAHEAVFSMVEAIYGDWKAANFDPFKRWPIPEFRALTASDCFVVESSMAKAPTITIEWQGPDIRRDEPATYAADVFSYINNQATSALSKALVQTGLAYSATMGYTTYRHVGPISIFIVPNPQKIKECMDEVKRQLSLMDGDDYLKPEQIETAKRMLEIKNIREADVTSDYVHSLAFWWASASMNYLAGYNDNLQKVTPADIKAYVRKYIKNKPYCAGLSISPELSSQVNAQAFFTAN